MFNTDGSIMKLVDLGLSYYSLKAEIEIDEKDLDNLDPADLKITQQESANFESHMKQKITSVRYLSPEQIFGKISLKSDIWGYGCTLLEMCTGIKPFDDINDNFKIGKMLCYDKITPLDYMVEMHP